MHHLLLGFDGSSAAWEALDRAAALAAAEGAHITVAHVVPVLVAGEHDSEPLRAADAALRARGFVPHLLLVAGNPGEQLERLAIEGDYDAVVVGSPPAGPLERLLTGSVTLHLVCHAPIPVIVARRP